MTAPFVVNGGKREAEWEVRKSNYHVISFFFLNLLKLLLF